MSNGAGKTFKGDNEWIDLKVKKEWYVSPNTKHLVFELEDKDHVSGLITASALLIKFAAENEDDVIRPYTPISDIEKKGEIELVVKKYEGSKAGTHIHNLKVGDSLSFKGPIVKWKWEPNQYESISLIGAGTGITPLYQLLHEITKNPEDKTKVNLFFGNLTKDDILIKKEIDQIASKHKEQVNVVYFLDTTPENWDGETGYISRKYLEKNLPGPSPKHKVFICGPPPLLASLSGFKVSPTDQGEVTGILAELNYTKDHVYKF
ncbi:NADH-cytochrome b5 reductase 2 [[Candida] railenensis]|uniref:NADH-cytochrome b5 reductase n=1 Tax=[Candida] railenensis TaxID=45579 RepID=A0A9P0QM02_9ASCO|nr:NADH-cytochrome b5 reductase 2 [[Candida] railenensis]